MGEISNWGNCVARTPMYALARNRRFCPAAPMKKAPTTVLDSLHHCWGPNWHTTTPKQIQWCLMLGTVHWRMTSVVPYRLPASYSYEYGTDRAPPRRDRRGLRWDTATLNIAEYFCEKSIYASHFCDKTQFCLVILTWSSSSPCQHANRCTFPFPFEFAVSVSSCCWSLTSRRASCLGTLRVLDRPDLQPGPCFRAR